MVTGVDSPELLWLESPRTLNLTDVEPTEDLEGFAVKVPVVDVHVTVLQDDQVEPSSVDVLY